MFSIFNVKILTNIVKNKTWKILSYLCHVKRFSQNKKRQKKKTHQNALSNILLLSEIYWFIYFCVYSLVELSRSIIRSQSIWLDNNAPLITLFSSSWKPSFQMSVLVYSLLHKRMHHFAHISNRPTPPSSKKLYSVFFNIFIFIAP